MSTSTRATWKTSSASNVSYDDLIASSTATFPTWPCLEPFLPKNLLTDLFLLDTGSLLNAFIDTRLLS